MTSTDAEQLASIRATADYQDFLGEVLEANARRVESARRDLEDAEATRRLQAAIAVRGGYGKAATALALGVSRPTLDKWLADVAADAEQTAHVSDHEAFVIRYHDRFRR